MRCRAALASLMVAVASAAQPAGAQDGGNPAALKAPTVDPSRFGARDPDSAYGAYQRGFYLTAFNLAKPRAEAGEKAAQTLLAELYSRGLGVRRDPARAAEWYAKAAAQGVPEAQFQYALILLDGDLAPQDRERAKALMQAAADAGNRLAQFNLAQMLVDRGGAAGLANAVTYYELAARQGLADAQFAMAEISANGVGGRKADSRQARRWLELAAQQNFDSAQVELGTVLVGSGEGEAAEKAGFAWLKRAAESGNVAGQIRLARLYRAGVGTDPDPVLAGAWYILARRAGLNDPELDAFISGLDAEERKQAIERANRLR